MSSTSPAATGEEPPSVTVTPADVFWEYLIRNREVCGHCFRQIRVEQPKPPAYALSKTMRMLVTTRAQPIEEGEWAFVPPPSDAARSRPDDRPSVEYEEGKPRLARPVRGPSQKRVVCEACGRVDGGPEEKSRGRLLRDAARAVERLAEQEVPVDEEALFCLLKQMKASPALQFQDRELLARAVEFGVGKAIGSTREWSWRES